MGYLPVTGGFRLRPMHLRGIENCIKNGVTDIEEIARLSAIPDPGVVEAHLTKVQKMNIAKAKKAEARKILGEPEPDEAE